MPSISIKKGETVVRLYDGERSQLKGVLVTLAALRPHLTGEAAKLCIAAEAALVELREYFPEPEPKPRKPKKQTVAA